MVGTLRAWKEREEAVERAWREAVVNVRHIGGCGSEGVVCEWTEEERYGSEWSRSVFMVAISVNALARSRNNVDESYAWISTAAGVDWTLDSGSLSSDSEPGGVEGSSSCPS